MSRWLGYLAVVITLGVLPARPQTAVSESKHLTCAGNRVRDIKGLNDRMLPGFKLSTFHAEAAFGCENVGQGGCGGYNSDDQKDCPCDMRPITSNCNNERTISCGYDDYCAKTNCHK